MNKPKRTTMAVTAEKKLKLERMAIDASHTAGKSIAWTDVVNYLIDNYAKDACDDLIAKAKAERYAEQDANTKNMTAQKNKQYS